MVSRSRSKWNGTSTHNKLTVRALGETLAALRRAQRGGPPCATQLRGGGAALRRVRALEVLLRGEEARGGPAAAAAWAAAARRARAAVRGAIVRVQLGELGHHPPRRIVRRCSWVGPTDAQVGVVEPRAVRRDVRAQAARRTRELRCVRRTPRRVRSRRHCTSEVAVHSRGGDDLELVVPGGGSNHDVTMTMLGGASQN